MDREFNVKYTNDMINRLLKVKDNNYSEKLETIKVKDSKVCIAKLLNEIPWENNNTSVSIGVTGIDGLLYEWNAKIVNWEDELSFMVTVKNVTKILAFERIESENRSKTELIRSVSHELRTPINAILLIIEDLFEEIPEVFQEKLSRIYTCVELLNYQISDILDYSELVVGNFILNPTGCDLKAALENCARLVRVQALHKGLELLVKIDPSIPDCCFFDEFRVRKVVMNLLSNAIKYTNKGCVELYAISTGALIDISVRDTGIGIHQERLASIFEMFSDHHSGISSGMSGLGLYISNNILKLANTSLKVYSTLGKGSKFSFSLDALIDIPQIDLSEEIEIPSEIHTSMHIPYAKIGYHKEVYPEILIVDDNDFNRMILGNILKKRAIQFVEAVNGEEAVEIILMSDRNKCPIRCVIMDCNMPVMDGWEATKIIINKYTQGIIRHLPNIIGHTAYTSRDDIQRCYESGMIAHFLKPTSQDQFLTIINNYV